MPTIHPERIKKPRIYTTWERRTPTILRAWMGQPNGLLLSQAVWVSDRHWWRLWHWTGACKKFSLAKGLGRPALNKFRSTGPTYILILGRSGHCNGWRMLVGQSRRERLHQQAAPSYSNEAFTQTTSLHHANQLSACIGSQATGSGGACATSKEFSLGTHSLCTDSGLDT